MRYLSVCSGIEAASVAWAPLGWTAAGFAEIEPFPAAVLASRFGAGRPLFRPDHIPEDDWNRRFRRIPWGDAVPNFGDFTQIEAHHVGPIDLLVGGTPCQSFSVAGKRLGLDDPRGNLALEFLALAQRLRPRWLVWENVPGVLSSWTGEAPQPGDDDGEGWQADFEETGDFHAFLDLFRECGYCGCFRVLDAQYVRVAGHERAVPQRRRRVFLVGHLGNGTRALPVLFDRESLCGASAPRREPGKGTAPTLGARSSSGGGLGTDFELDGGLIAGTVSAKWAKGSGGPAGDEHYNLVAAPVAAGHANAGGQLAVAYAMNNYTDGTIARIQIAPSLTTGTDKDRRPLIVKAYELRGREGGAQFEGPHDTANIRAASGGSSRSCIATQWAVRRLTPRECERLQGFPESQNCFTILVCRDFPDQQKVIALAALQCRKLQSNAWTAGAEGWTLSAEAAAHHSNTSLADPAPPVAADVLIDLERRAVQIHSAGRSILLAANARASSEFPLPTGIDSFVRLAVRLTHAWAQAMQDGKAVLQLNTPPSTHLLNGNCIAISYGREIEEHAADAESDIKRAIHFFTSTTSPSGADTEALRSAMTTLCCCVVHAIAGFIPDTTSNLSSFAVRLTTSQGYTNIDYRGKQAADGPRYRALGNSMAVNVMRWIGERIQMVEALAPDTDEAA